ncbi:hypothetical protein [Salinibacter altiplanensis]|uniref:hypothetical protein n=1 Tax=Salinibacter altiplanensis TaxID=1803181 RepID=UPI001F2941B2|nr:hypothetical protein [Salinibacter altiplanensis]
MAALLPVAILLEGSTSGAPETEAHLRQPGPERLGSERLGSKRLEAEWSDPEQSQNKQLENKQLKDLQLKDLASSYERRLTDSLKEGLPFRDDGFAYAVDLGNTMRAAVALGNRRLFDRAWGMIREQFLQVDTDDPRAKHTVLWRYKPGVSPDASGSKETGLLADALWEAHKRWESPEHHEMATQVLGAYLEHGYWETDRRFIVKNYYNYGTQTLSESTWVLNQMPHTIRKIACGTGDPSLLRHARGMARFTEAAYLKDGFSQEMYDRGIQTVFEDSDGYYSPNGRLKLQSSLEIARALFPFNGAPAREIVGFLRERYPDVYSHYYYNPRSEKISPLGEAPRQTYALSERALTLLLATRFRDSLGEQFLLEEHFLRDFAAREIIPKLKKRKGEASSTSGTFYFDIPLVLEAIQRYLGPREASGSAGRENCEQSSGRLQSSGGLQGGGSLK